MTSRFIARALVFGLMVGIPCPGLQPAGVPVEPGPLNGGESGARFKGPGFALYLPAKWSVVLDDVGSDHQARGERGTVRGPVFGVTNADATIRFEPFPLAAGMRATPDEFAAHVRATLAAGLPVGVQPLLPRFSREALTPRGDEPEGVAIHFTRPGPDGTESSQRRYFVYAYPRQDGRLQTLLCSHRGHTAPRIRSHSPMGRSVESRKERSTVV